MPFAVEIIGLPNIPAFFWDSVCGFRAQSVHVTHDFGSGIFIQP
jgi:hypothetical protein